MFWRTHSLLKGLDPSALKTSTSVVCIHVTTHYFPLLFCAYISELSHLPSLATKKGFGMPLQHHLWEFPRSGLRWVIEAARHTPRSPGLLCLSVSLPYLSAAMPPTGRQFGLPTLYLGRQCWLCRNPITYWSCHPCRSTTSVEKAVLLVVVTELSIWVKQNHKYLHFTKIYPISFHVLVADLTNNCFLRYDII